MAQKKAAKPLKRTTQTIGSGLDEEVLREHGFGDSPEPTVTEEGPVVDENTEPEGPDDDPDATDTEDPPEEDEEGPDSVSGVIIQKVPSDDETADVPDWLKNAPTPGVILRSGDPLKVHGFVIGNHAHLTDPVYLARKPINAQRWQYHLLYAKGATIPMDTIRRSGGVVLDMRTRGQEDKRESGAETK